MPHSQECRTSEKNSCVVSPGRLDPGQWDPHTPASLGPVGSAKPESDRVTHLPGGHGLGERTDLK